MTKATLSSWRRSFSLDGSRLGRLQSGHLQTFLAPRELGHPSASQYTARGGLPAKSRDRIEIQSSSARSKVRPHRPRRCPGLPGTPLREPGIAARPPAAPHSGECRSLPHTCHRRTCRSRARRRSRRQERARRRARDTIWLQPPARADRSGSPTLRAGASSTEGVICSTPIGTSCATSGSGSCSFYPAARATRRSRHPLTDGRLRAVSRSTRVVMEARSHPSPPRAEATRQVVPVPPEAVALADRFELVLGVGRRDGCGGHATDHAHHRACAEYRRPGPRWRSDDSAPDAEWYTREWPLLDVAWPRVREVIMRYGWIALLLLLAGCAGSLPPAAGHPAPSTFD